MNEELDDYILNSSELWKTISTLNKVKNNYLYLVKKNNKLKNSPQDNNQSETLFDFSDIMEALGNGYLELTPEEIPARNKLLLEKIKSIPERMKNIENQIVMIQNQNTLLELRRLTPTIKLKP